MIVHHEITGDGPPLVLSSSLGTTLAVWDPQLDSLAARFRVIRYDHRGHGRSPSPPGPYSIRDLATDVIVLLDRLGLERVCFAGLSLGGMTGMWLAAHAPGRVAALALASTSAYLGARMWRERIEAVRAGGTAAIAGTVAERWFTADFRMRHPRQVARCTAMLADTSDVGYLGCCAAIADMDLRADLAGVSAPTLVLAGADDPATPPAHAREIASRIGDAATCTVLPGAAHLLNFELPDQVTRALQEHFGRYAHDGTTPR